MFLVDVSPSMGKTRRVRLPGARSGGLDPMKMTNLEWSLQFVMLKIQEMIYNGRKTDQCGVILFGSEGTFYHPANYTENIINKKNGGYENVLEFIPIAQPNAGTLAKLATLQPSETIGDPIDALIVGIETQHQYLSSKKTWTRKVVLLTDGENPIEIEDWEAIVKKMNLLDISLTIIGIDFDDDELPFHEEGKTKFKRANESFYHTFVEKLQNGVVGNCNFALRELARPDIKQTKSTLMGNVLRIGDVDVCPEEAVEIVVKASKCTAVTRPKSWKKFAKRESAEGQHDMRVNEDEEAKAIYAQLRMRTEYYIDQEGEMDDNASMDGDQDDDSGTKSKTIEKVEKEQLVRGFKYGSSYAPCPDGQFPRLPTRKGIEICGFFPEKRFRREYAMSEVTYVWADPVQPLQQVALSAVVQAMYEKGAFAIARWIARDGADPKMGVLVPTMFEKVDCLLWVQVCRLFYAYTTPESLSIAKMPFADDVRNFAFPSLDMLINKKGEIIATHPYLPTEDQMDAMERFVDAMDLMEAGEKDDEGNRTPWFDTRLSYNPSIHRVKQAQFHAAVVPDLNTHPLPPTHPELTKYFDPPRRVLKRAHDAIDECKRVFKVKEVPRKVVRVRKDGHVRARDDDDDTILLDKFPQHKQAQTQAQAASQVLATTQHTGHDRQTHVKDKKINVDDSETESETEDEEELLLDKTPAMLPTPGPDQDTESGSGLAPGRIIGSTYPLEDFKQNIAQGDVVTKAVEDLGVVIKEVLLRPFASRRTEEMLQCMQELRKVTLEEDEIDAWNAFLRDLRDACVNEQPGNKEFWTQVQELGRDISLISQPEAAKLGGKSDVSELEAARFV
ncbi:uncharacterized protein FIBRA_01660 [Fibroporia radiculosa]|uniref:ATP-dependent DNA helicase II subunit 2 n=1 Tax=Fibroporia radiculosa TaxID=599839 RepID=J4GKX9_9APHY|nr:uncharacterized protein FIBRA_01660 [Fibroporia radiculosa]CCL99640.1 predicted protein [Fibroporia radiculosa]